MDAHGLVRGAFGMGVGRHIWLLEPLDGVCNFAQIDWLCRGSACIKKKQLFAPKAQQHPLKKREARQEL